jgi:hypothetical protein
MFGPWPPTGRAAHAATGSAPAGPWADATATSRAPRWNVDRGLPLAGICLLPRRASDATGCAAAVLRRLSPSAAYPGVLAHAFCFRLDDPARKRAMLERYLTLVARTPVFELAIADDLTRLHEVIETLARAFGEETAR